MVDVTTPEGRDFQELVTALLHRQNRVERLDRYMRGEPPLPEGLSQLQDVLQDFVRTSRTNFAELVVEAPRERMQPAGIRTAVASGESGDSEGWKRWTAARLPVLSADVHQSMLALGDGYVIVSWDTAHNRPVVTAEDPRQVITLHDPVTDDVRLALKLYRDHVARLDIAYMYRPGQVIVATKPSNDVTKNVTTFGAGEWTWDVDRSQPLPDGFGDVIPVVRFKNRGVNADGSGVGEFERHIDVLDRINRSILRGLVIMTFQAFKQRALTGVTEANMPDKDDAGNTIDYNQYLEMGPDSLMLLPPDVAVWESGQASLDGIISFAKNDVLLLAATTRTPLAMFSPDAATQSAEGATFQREGLSFKTEDRIARASAAWAEVMSLVFRFAGDAQRAPAESIEILWAPVERYSISEQANAVAQTKGVVSRREQLIRFVGMTPEQADRTLTELTDDLLLDQQYAVGLQAATAGNDQSFPPAAA